MYEYLIFWFNRLKLILNDLLWLILTKQKNENCYYQWPKSEPSGNT